jgi:DNA polymerase-1
MFILKEEYKAIKIVPSSVSEKNKTKILDSENETADVYLIDCSGFIFRAYHALPPLTREDGTPIGAVYGFCHLFWKMLQRIYKKNHKHPMIFGVFDSKTPTFRRELYHDYKSNRITPPDDLKAQFPLVEQACESFKIPMIQKDGFEADDLIATYTKMWSAQNKVVQIVSSDKDLYQLLSPPLVEIYDPIKNQFIQYDDCIKKFGVPPHQVVDVQALAGDTSDHIPGVAGIGYKTAAQLITQFGTLNQLYKSILTIQQTKRRETLITHEKEAFLSYELCKLRDDLCLELDMTSLTPYALCSNGLISFLKTQGMKKLIEQIENYWAHHQDSAHQVRRVMDEHPPQEHNVHFTHHLVQDIETLKKIAAQAVVQKIMAIDTETTSLRIDRASLVGISMALKQENGPLQSFYIPLRHQYFTHPNQHNMDLEEVKPILNKLFEDEAITKVGHNIKYDLSILAHHGFGSLNNVHDSMLMSYVLHMGMHGHGLDELSHRYLHYTPMSYKQLVGTGKNERTIDEVDIEQVCFYSGEDSALSLLLFDLFFEHLCREEALLKLYDTIERPLIHVISTMEQTGILIDAGHFKKLSTTFHDQQIILEDQIYALSKGKRFNLASPKQLSQVLFEDLAIAYKGKKTKTGLYPTDASVLEQLSEQGHEIATLVLQWRSISKLQSTYVHGLLEAMNPQTQRIHTSFSMVGTATGRLSSSDPNVQNIPIKTPNGRLIRQGFIASAQYTLVSFDYSQIELRLLAHFAHVPVLQEAFIHRQDIHAITASYLFQEEVSKVSIEMRRYAKTINFGILYGISPFGLAKQLHIPTSKAAQIIDDYFDRYPGIQEYIQAQHEKASTLGYVETIFQRRCHIVGINDRNTALRQFAQRQAANAPLQGSNADLIKKAMIEVFDFLKSHQATQGLLLQVHDELLCEIANDQLAFLIPSIKSIMESVACLKVPLVVDVGQGPHWAATH